MLKCQTKFTNAFRLQKTVSVLMTTVMILSISHQAQSETLSGGQCSHIFDQNQLEKNNPNTANLVNLQNENAAEPGPSTPKGPHRGRVEGYDPADPLKALRSAATDKLFADPKLNSTAEIIRLAQELDDLKMQRRDPESRTAGRRNSVLDESESVILRLVSYWRLKEWTSLGKGSLLGIFGYDTVQAWKAGDDFLNEIPKGQLKFSEKMLHILGGFSADVLKPLPINLPFQIPGITPDKTGAFKLLPNSGRSALREPLTEEQYKIIKQNKLITGFFELPYPLSRPNSRRGIIVYAMPHTVRAKLQNLFRWYEENKGKLDPIRLAVQFQRDLVSIHPWVDGNGRNSRLLMDRILAEFGLPAPIILDRNLDLFSDLNTYEASVRQGIIDSINVMANDSDSSLSTSLNFKSLFSAIPHFELNTPLVEEIARNYKKAPKLITINGKDFYLKNDGFLYDVYDIPFIFHKGTLYPMADRNLSILDWSSPLKKIKLKKSELDSKTRRVVNTEEEFNVKEISPLKLKIVSENFKFLKDFSAGKLTEKDIHIIPITQIADANRTGKFHIYSWQKHDLAEAIRRVDRFELAELSPFYSDRSTGFENMLRADPENVNASLILAQYQLVDRTLLDLMETTKPGEFLYKIIQEERFHIHKIARKHIEQKLAKLNELPEGTVQTLKETYQFRLFKAYYQASNLSYRTLTDAIQAGVDKKVLLIREANEGGLKFGYIPPVYIKRIIDKLPGGSVVFDRLREFNDLINSENGLEQLKQSIDSRKWMPFSFKKKLKEILEANISPIKDGLENLFSFNDIVEKQRIPVSKAGFRKAYQLSNRADGDNGSSGISFSMNPALYYTGLQFAQGRDGKGGLGPGIRIVQSNPDVGTLNWVSPFVNEYEFVVDKRIPISDTIFQLSEQEIKREIPNAAGIFEDKKITEVVSGILGSLFIVMHGSAPVSPEAMGGE